MKLFIEPIRVRCSAMPKDGMFTGDSGKTPGGKPEIMGSKRSVGVIGLLIKHEDGSVRVHPVSGSLAGLYTGDSGRTPGGKPEIASDDSPYYGHHEPLRHQAEADSAAEKAASKAETAAARRAEAAEARAELAEQKQATAQEKKAQEAAQAQLKKAGENGTTGTKNKGACNYSVQAMAKFMGHPLPDLQANELVEYMSKNWNSVSPEKAQVLANNGVLVVAGAFNTNAGHSGHVAVVYPGGGKTVSGEFFPQLIGGAQRAAGYSAGEKTANQVFGRQSWRDKVGYWTP